MKEQIKQALEQLKGAEWTNFDDVPCEHNNIVERYDRLTEKGIEIIATCKDTETATLIANAPEWLRWQNERIEQLEKALKELRASVYGIDCIVNVAVGYGEELDYGSLSVELNRIANEASQALGKEV